MAHFLRLSLAVLLAFVSLAANAFQPVLGYYIGDLSGASEEAVCQAYTSSLKPTGYYDSYRFVGVESHVCHVMAMAHGHDASSMATAITQLLGCPTNSTTSGSGSSATCTCKTDYFEHDNGSGGIACVKPDDRTPDQLCNDLGMIWNSTLNPDRFGRVPGPLAEYAQGKTVCHDAGPGSGLPDGVGCKHKFTGDIGFQDSASRWWVNGWSSAYDDSDKSEVGGKLTCSLEQPDPPTEKQPADCRNGYKGSVNGVEVCIEAWKGQNEGNDWTHTQGADGGSSDTNTNVKCTGDQCTVTQTTTTHDASGNLTGSNTTVTDNVDRTQYCSKNPKSSICERSEDDSSATKGQDGKGKGDGEPPKPSSFGGACGGNFSCEGDAIQCAIAQEQHRRDCAMFETPSDESRLFATETAKTGNRTIDLPGNETVDIASRIDSSDLIGGGSGVQDLTITVMNQTVTLPLSNVNPALAALGNVLVMVSFLIAYRIVGRG